MNNLASSDRVIELGLFHYCAAPADAGEELHRGAPPLQSAFPLAIVGCVAPTRRRMGRPARPVQTNTRCFASMVFVLAPSPLIVRLSAERALLELWSHSVKRTPYNKPQLAPIYR